MKNSASFWTVILCAMYVYGIVLADNSSNWYVGGAPVPRFANDMLHLLDVVTGNDFKAVDTYILTVNPDSGQVQTPQKVTLPA